MSDWQQRWETFSARSSDARREAELAQSRIRSLEDAIEQLRTRQRKLEDEKALLEDQVDRTGLEALQEEQQTLSMQRETFDERMAALQEQVSEARQHSREAEQAVTEHRQQVQSLRAALESQQALLDEQLGSQDTALQDWLGDHNLTDAPRIAAAVRIDDGWEFAVEQVIGRFTQGLALPGFDDLAQALASAPRGLALADAKASGPMAENGLGAKVSGPVGLGSVLAGIGVADTLDQALARRSSLREGESLMTRAGVWVARDWLLMPTSEAGQVGIIERQNGSNRPIAGWKTRRPVLSSVSNAWSRPSPNVRTSSASRLMWTAS
jgi:chromosome segregation protein